MGNILKFHMAKQRGRGEDEEEAKSFSAIKGSCDQSILYIYMTKIIKIIIITRTQ